MRIFVIFLFLSGCALHAGEPVVFSQTYLPGHEYRQTVTMEQGMTADLGTQKVERKTSTTLGMRLTAREVPGDAGLKRVTVRYERVAGSMSDGDKKHRYDSEAPDAANAGPLGSLARVVGQQFTVVYDGGDQVKEVEGIDGAVRNLASADATSSRLYQQLFSKEAVERMMQQSALRSPEGQAMKGGESWPFVQDVVLPGIGKLAVRGFYTYAGEAEHGGVKCAKVTAKADISIEVGRDQFENDQAANRLREMELKIEKGTMEGTFLYDPAIRFTRNAMVNQDMVLTARIPDGSGRTIRMPMQQTIKMTLDAYGKTPAEPASDPEL